MIPANLNYLHTTVLLRQLAAGGAKRAVISPGSRSTPLALVAYELPELSSYVLTDERSAGFFALGLSKADGVPAILICTSGTAAANYFPAVIEAAQSCVPLIVLTADRPAAMRNTGAPQTIDQVNLYGSYPRFFADLPEAELSHDHARLMRAIAAQAYAAAVSVPQGPVHLNVPLDEPLTPIAQDGEKISEILNLLDAEKIYRVPSTTAPEPDVHAIQYTAQQAITSLCGLIVAGPDAARTTAEADAILHLGRKLGWPIMADVTSGLRFLSEPVIPYYDIFLREETLASLTPDIVLTFGAHPVSKVLNAYLDRHRAANTIRIQPHKLGQDPQKRANEIIEADIASFSNMLATLVPASRDSLIYEPFRAAAERLRAQLAHETNASCEGIYVLRAVREMPDGANIVLANSLSIRYADALCAAEGKRYSVFAMRGASGIDGTISHAAGIAAASNKSTLLVTGDLAFLHDLGGLAASKFAPQLKILLLNNNGGGIFHFLPVHEQESQTQFEVLYGTPHGLKLAAAAELFGLDWHMIDRPEDLSILGKNAASRTLVCEVRITREENHRSYTAFIERLSYAVNT
ncbi:2-succinyl-5-enolpyruvyl-6-hydroxy-3-cyclohexene-1-carboxylic-acid synthase [candidate division KSB1 bacterium]|nr:MAG: 2-succinyl-5-enolpyruvyl-6-hydroxy-3-cyclohexene-1-carboxylic-acid synthase [candidate division KSB1 bacterium]